MQPLLLREEDFQGTLFGYYSFFPSAIPPEKSQDRSRKLLLLRNLISLLGISILPSYK
jgi:hypothetical protein